MQATRIYFRLSGPSPGQSELFFLCYTKSHCLIRMKAGEVIQFSIRLKKLDIFHKIINMM